MVRVLFLRLLSTLTLLFLSGTLSHAEDKKTEPKIDISSVVKGNNEFAFDLYRQLAKEAKPNENILFSPYSISAAMAMVYGGSEGEAAEQIAKVMHYDRDQEKFHPAFAELTRQLMLGEDFKGELSIANAIWMDHVLKLRDPFEKLMTINYDGAMQRVQFEASELVRKKVNEWISDKTKKQIVSLLPERSITRQTKIILTNAIFFKGEWQYQFDPKMTSKGIFNTKEGKKQESDFMHQVQRYPCFETDLATIATLPFSGNRLIVTIFFPTHRDAMTKFEEQLSIKTLNETQKNSTPALVDLRMPRFRYFVNSEIKRTLVDLGVHSIVKNSSFNIAFKELDTPVNITSIFHCAAFEVTEQGAQGAAVTAVRGARPVSGVIGTSQLVALHLDRPFIFTVSHTETGQILFIGRIAHLSIE